MNVQQDRADATTPSRYMSLRQLAAYSGVSKNTLRKYLAADPAIALPCYRLPGRGKILVAQAEFDNWMAAFRSSGSPRLRENLRDLGLL